MQSKLLLPVLIIILVGAAIGGLVYLSGSDGGATASGVSVEDLMAGKAGNQRVKLQLQVTNLISKDKVIEFEANGIPPEGQPENPNAPKVRVVYSGNDRMPIEAWSHVAVSGKWDPEAGVFHATTMATQCPSRYENQGLPKQPASGQRATTTLP